MNKKLGIGALVVGGISLIYYLTTKAPATREVQLLEGWNHVTYYGKPQPAKDALASIVDYISVMFYWNPETKLWEQILADTILQTGFTYSIGVTQACVWIY